MMVMELRIGAEAVSNPLMLHRKLKRRKIFHVLIQPKKLENTPNLAHFEAAMKVSTIVDVLPT